MNQPFVALRGFAAANAIDLGSNTYRITLAIADDTAVYDGLSVAAGQKLIKAGDGGPTGQMKVYEITSITTAFSSQVTIVVTDTDVAGTPGFGNMAIVEPNSSGQVPVVSGIDEGLKQAITQYNLQFGGASLYSADGQLAGTRAVDQNGNSLTFQDGVQSVIVSAGAITATDDIEVTGSGNGIIRTAPDGSRFLETTNNLGVMTSTKLA